MKALRFLSCGVVAAHLCSCGDTTADGTTADGTTADGTSAIGMGNADSTVVGTTTAGATAIGTSNGDTTTNGATAVGASNGGSTVVGTSNGGATSVSTTVGGATEVDTSLGGTNNGGAATLDMTGGSTGGDSTVTDTTAGGMSNGGASMSNGGMAAGGMSNGGAAGGPSNGGTAAGGRSDGGAAGGGSEGSCTPNLALCDDFESYATGQVPDGRWQTVRTPSQGASLVVDNTKSFSGTQALHITANFQGYSGANIRTKSDDAAFATGDTYYVRFMLFQTALTNTDELHARMVRIGTMDLSNGDDGSGYTFGLHSYPKPISLQLESMNDTFVSTRVDPPLDKWVCWEVEFGPNIIGWWQDGEVINSPQPGGWAQVALSVLQIGFEAYTPVTTELWYDDIAVDTERIGCPTMQ